MALSNWDVLAFDENAEPSIGEIRSLSGAVCEIYKNWLYVGDERAWRDGDSFVHPTIAQIWSGGVSMFGLNIHADRAPQDGVFCLVNVADGDGVRRMAGIGCYGWKHTGDVVMREEGLDPAEWEFLCHESSRRPGETCWTLAFTFCRINGCGDSRMFSRPDRTPYSTRWVGVEPSTYAAFLEWLRSKKDNFPPTYSEWVERVAAAMPMRCNQGDLLIEGQLCAEIADVTPVGEAGTPLFVRAFDDDGGV
jgi:hypothetical protein